MGPETVAPVRGVGVLDVGVKVVDDQIAGLPVLKRIVFRNGKRVERNGPLDVGGIEYHHVVRPVRRHPAKDVLDQRPVRVDDAHAAAAADVVHNLVEHEGGLPGARLPNDVVMVETRLSVQTHQDLATVG